MALPWVRMDTQWPSNPKFLMLAEDKQWRAITAYWAALSWSGGQGLSGFVPYYALPQTFATRREANVLGEVRLWVPGEGGWQINDFTEHQPSHEEHEKRSARAREAAQIRWARERANGHAAT